MELPPTPRTIQNRYILQEFIGRGKFGSVFRGTNRFTRTPVAIKMERGDVHILAHEVGILHYLAPVCKTIPEVHWFGQYLDKPCLVMTLYTQSLQDYVAALDAPPSVPTQCKFMQEILTTLGQVHSAGIVHRDIKPRNFMMTASGDLHLIDFGMASVVAEERDRDEDSEAREVMVGNVQYASPAVMGGGRPTRVDDLISAGYVCLFFTQGADLFMGDSLTEIAAKKRLESVLALATGGPSGLAPYFRILYEERENPPAPHVLQGLF